jgi:hypothetical protein
MAMQDFTRGEVVESVGTNESVNLIKAFGF